MKFYRLKKQYVLSGLIISGLLLLSCDNTLEPIDKDLGIYAIYGALDLNEPVNYVRVKDLNAPFTPEATKKIDAIVSFENLKTGSTVILEQAPEMQFDDIYLHNYVIDEQIEANISYKITAERSDGVSLSLTTLSPTNPEPQIFPQNENCYTPISIEFEPLNGGTLIWSIGFPYGPIRWLAGNVENLDEADEKLSITITPFEELQKLIGFDLSCYELTNDSLYLNIDHYSPGFYEKIENDPFDILASTDRFGAFYDEMYSFSIDTSRVCPQDCTDD